jgi:hypothetical protein
MLASRQRHDTVIMRASPTSNSAQSSSKKLFLEKLPAPEAFPGENSRDGRAIQVAFSGVPYIYGLPIDAKLLHCIRELGHNFLLLVNGTALYGCRG